MKSKRNLFYVAAIFCFSFALVSWTTNTDGYEKPSDAINGEQLFKDIIFFEGNSLTKEVSEFSRFSRLAEERGNEKNKPFAEFKDFTIALIKAQDPQYFEKFKSIIQRNNPNEIQELLSSSFSLVSVAQTIYSSDERRRNEYMNVFHVTKDLLSLEGTKSLLQETHNRYEAINGEISPTKQGGIITTPVMPGIVYTYIPPCSIVAVCAVVSVMDAKTSMDNSRLLTDKVVAAIIKYY